MAHSAFSSEPLNTAALLSMTLRRSVPLDATLQQRHDDDKLEDDTSTRKLRVSVCLRLEPRERHQVTPDDAKLKYRGR